MFLDLSLPLDNTYIPKDIATIIETGGMRFSQFQPEIEYTWKAVNGTCFCGGVLDSKHCGPTVSPYFGGEVANYADRQIATTPPCNHEWHAGCLRQALQDGAGMNKCPACDTKWYDHADDLRLAYITGYDVQQLRNGVFNNPAIFDTTRELEVNGFLFNQSLALSAYALGWYQQSQERREVLEAMMAYAEMHHGEKTDTHTFLYQVSSHAAGVISGDPRKSVLAPVLVHFVNRVLGWAIQHYLR